MSRRPQTVLVRTIAVGGAAVCIGFVAEMNPPDADALSILLPAGNGNATQINILEGNVFRPQMGLGGNVSNNRTIGSIIFGGNDPTGSSDFGMFGPIALGGATGNGNVTQVNILSYNIFNPQFSLSGSNVSGNTTISNVAAGNGNGTSTTAASGAGIPMLGGAMGNGNTTQIALFSGNIFNPQLSLFGSNISNNTAVTNVSAVNGNGSQTAATSGGLFGTTLLGGVIGNGNTTQVAGASGNIVNPQFSLFGSNSSNNTAVTNVSAVNGNGSQTVVSSGGFLGTTLLGGMTGNGNTNQFAGGVSNIVNPQWTFGGLNESDNTAGSNSADWNGNGSDNEVTSPGGGNNTVVGTNGNGNVNQTGTGNGNIFNDQFRLFTGLTQPQPQAAPPQIQQQQAQLTNADVSSGNQQQAGSGEEVLLEQLGGQQRSVGAPSGSAAPGALGSRVADVVKRTSDAVKGALGLNKPAGGSGTPSNSEPTG